MPKEGVPGNTVPACKGIHVPRVGCAHSLLGAFYPAFDGCPQSRCSDGGGTSPCCWQWSVERRGCALRPRPGRGQRSPSAADGPLCSQPRDDGHARSPQDALRAGSTPFAPRPSRMWDRNPGAVWGDGPELRAHALPKFVTFRPAEPLGSSSVSMAISNASGVETL